MGNKEKNFYIEYVRVDGNSNEIIRSIARKELEWLLESQGVVSYNLDDVLSKYIAGDVQNGQKEG